MAPGKEPSALKRARVLFHLFVVPPASLTGPIRSNPKASRQRTRKSRVDLSASLLITSRHRLSCHPQSPAPNPRQKKALRSLRPTANFTVVASRRPLPPVQSAQMASALHPTTHKCSHSSHIPRITHKLSKTRKAKVSGATSCPSIITLAMSLCYGEELLARWTRMSSKAQMEKRTSIRPSMRSKREDTSRLRSKALLPVAISLVDTQNAVRHSRFVFFRTIY